jgi:glycosyltransferase involved in cell wall biosynthesis
MAKKIAIFHNFLDNIGGAEIVDLQLARELGADIYTTNIDEEKIKKLGFSTNNIYSIGRVPINAPLKQELAYWKFRRLNLGRKYDFYIIAGDWAMSGAVKNEPNLWYVYSPTREIWDLYRYTREKTVPFLLKPFFDLWVLLRRLINRYDVKKVDKIISTSQNVAQRVKKYFGYETKIIYPPVDCSKYHYKPAGGYWLSVNRLITHKRVEIQLEAFRQMSDKKLIIVGSYEQSRHFKRYADFIESSLPPNVEIRNWVSDQELINLYANCRGFITTAKDEDFGLTVLEAMSSGKPVIAPNEGGYKETVVNGQTGLLLDGIDADKLTKAVAFLEDNLGEYKDACQWQAQKFDLKIFVEKIKKEVEN